MVATIKTIEMTVEQAIKELSAMSKDEFNDWFDTTLSSGKKFITLIGGTENMRHLCAEWYIEQAVKKSGERK